MSNKDLRLGMVATLQDKGATVAARQISRAVEREAERSSRATTAAADRAAQGQERAMRRERDAASRMYQDRERLGIRSERRIQREIDLTAAAYRRLASSGTLSANEQSRALERTTQRVAALRREMAATNRQEQQAGRGEGFLRRGLGLYQSGAAAVMGAGYVLSRPAWRAMNYDMKLRTMANMAYSGQDVAGKEAGMREMHAVIAKAISGPHGAGTMDQAADALAGMLNEGAVDPKTAIKLLPLVNKIATSNPGTSAVDLGRIAGALKQFGLSDEQLPRAFDKIVVASQAGKIELPDLASEFPKVVDQARGNGMYGMRDLDSILGGLETSALAAGTPGQAMTNFTDLLVSLKSQHSQRQAAMIPIAPGKGIDLIGSLNNLRRTKGMNSLEGAAYILDKAVNYDPRYKKLKGEFDATQDPDKRASIQSQMNLIEGSIVSKLFPNQEAQQAMMGYMGNQKKLEENTQAIRDAGPVNDQNFDFISRAPEYKAQQLANQERLKEYDLYNGKVIAGLGNLAKSLADLADKYPKLAAAAVFATHALEAVGAAAGGLAFISMIRGKGGAGGAALAREAAAVETTVSRSAPGLIGKLAKGARKFIPGIGWVVAGAEGLSIVESDEPTREKAKGLTKLATGTGGAWVGAETGFALGAMTGPAAPVAAPLLSLVGGATGYFLGDKFGDLLNKYIYGRTSIVPPNLSPEQRQTAADAFAVSAPHLIGTGMPGVMAPVRVDIQLHVENGNLMASLKDEFNREGRRY